MTRYTTATNTTLNTTKKLGEGGEGAVFDIAGQSGLVAKIYHPARLNASLAAKVIAMTRNPPEDATRKSLNHVSIAWPIDVLYNGTQFVGYTMPKIKKSDDLYDLLQPQQRAKEHSGLNHRHLYRTARNLALAMDAIHQKGYVIGDVNFKNALFNDDALITMVDCDSMQVTDAAGIVHHCLVGVPEYTPADLQGMDFARVTRTPNHDAFGLAILIFQLLMQGFHPFAGKPRPGEKDVEQSHIYCISKGIFPYLANQPYEPPRAAPSMLCLPVLIQQQFERAFTKPDARPTPKEWANLLAMVEPRLIPCPNDASHWYPSDGHCVICEIDYNVGRRQRTSPKPSTTVQMQVPLPPQPSMTTGPLRPAAISRPVVNTPQSRPSTQPVAQPPRPAPATPRPTPPASPTTAVAPAAQSLPVAPPRSSQNLPPLVSPQSAPRVVPPKPQPRQPQVDLLAQITTFISAHRIVLVPIAVIVLALVMVLSSTWTGQSSPVPDISIATLPDATATEIIVPTDKPAATVETKLTVAPALSCSSAAIIDAHWPMVPADIRTAMHAKPLTTTTRPYDSPVLNLVGTFTAASPSTRFAELAATCQKGILLQSNPLAYTTGDHQRTERTCVRPGCEIVTPEYRVVFIRNAVNDNDNKEQSGTFDILFHFFDRPNPLGIKNVGFLADASAGKKSLALHLLPFIQSRILIMKVGNPIWQNARNGTETTMVDVASGEQYYDEKSGITRAPADLKLTQFSRVIALPDQRWSDGSQVTAADYVKGFTANLNESSVLITQVEAAGPKQIVIRYIAGLPQVLADVIAPLALHGEDILDDSMGSWAVERNGMSMTVAHTSDPRKSFTVTSLTQVQQMVSGLRKGIYDVAITEPEQSPALLEALVGVDMGQYTIRLVPTGTLWVLQQ